MPFVFVVGHSLAQSGHLTKTKDRQMSWDAVPYSEFLWISWDVADGTCSFNYSCIWGSKQLCLRFTPGQMVKKFSLLFHVNIQSNSQSCLTWYFPNIQSNSVCCAVHTGICTLLEENICKFGENSKSRLNIQCWVLTQHSHMHLVRRHDQFLGKDKIYWFSF